MEPLASSDYLIIYMGEIIDLKHNSNQEKQLKHKLSIDDDFSVTMHFIMHYFRIVSVFSLVCRYMDVNDISHQWLM